MGGRACLGVIWLMSSKAIEVLILIGYLLILELYFSVLQWCFFVVLNWFFGLHFAMFICWFTLFMLDIDSHGQYPLEYNGCLYNKLNPKFTTTFYLLTWPHTSQNPQTLLFWILLHIYPYLQLWKTTWRFKPATLR